MKNKIENKNTQIVDNQYFIFCYFIAKNKHHLNDQLERI